MQTSKEGYSARSYPQPLEFRTIINAFYKRRCFVDFIRETLGVPVGVELSSIAVGPVAGRDSVAGPLKAFEERKIRHYVPVIIELPSDKGERAILFSNAELLRKTAMLKFSASVYGPLVVRDFESWHMLLDSVSKETERRLGFYRPCVVCHLYLEGIRGVIARMLGSRTVISGAREDHDGTVKLSQTPQALDATKALLAEFGVEEYQPLRKISKGSEITDIIGSPWEERERQMKCIHSGMVFSSGGRPLCTAEVLKDYYENFTVPVVKDIIAKRLDQDGVLPKEKDKRGSA